MTWKRNGGTVGKPRLSWGSKHHFFPKLCQSQKAFQYNLGTSKEGMEEGQHHLVFL